MRWRSCGAGVVGALLLVPLIAPALAAPLTAEDVAATCANAEGLAHCGRLIEALQLPRLPGLAVRDGDTLHVNLYPAGRTSFTDAANGERSYTLWDYLDPVNVAVLYTVHGDDASFLLLQRATGRSVEVPAEPKLSPDRQRFATADVCTNGCRNEIALWRVDRQGIRKEARLTPGERWSDATVRWKNPETVVVEFTRAGDESTGVLERRITDAVWTRVAP